LRRQPESIGKEHSQSEAYPHLSTLARRLCPSNAVGQAGGMLLTETVHTSGLGHQLRQALAAWTKPVTIHDPGKVLTDVALTLALGGDALSDSSVLRDEPDLYGPMPRSRRSLASSALSPPTPTKPWQRSTPLGRLPVPACGNYPATRHRTMTVKLGLR